ncbi:NAD(P)-binding protein [Rickettsiales bacterium]|nr:NAD(P)-binding protein [Rickettsiales bacterium]
MKKVAIIGSGISGLSISWLLNKKYDITLFEKNNYIGGHSNTAQINYKNSNIAVDTGFIVFNFRTYPNLKAFFELLNVKIEKSNMSFGIKDFDSNIEYSGNSLNSLFSQRKNIFNPRFIKMLFDINKFNKRSIKFIENNKVKSDKTLLEFVKDLKLGTYFQNYYLFPMAGAIWSCSLDEIKDYPAKTFLQFFYNHGLLTILNQPQWYTVSGGSKEYVKKIIASFSDKIKLNCNIIKSQSKNNITKLQDDKGNSYEFDEVIFACHSDQALKIIQDKNNDEKNILSAIKFNKNKAILHKSLSQMPKNKKAWASWVYLSSKKSNKTSLSYWMNNLQNIDQDKPLFVTLNPIEKINKKDIFAEFNYQHPIFNKKAIKAQESLDKIQGKRGLWFCGAWTKYGFHEDGLNSSLKIAKKFDVEAPW